MDPNQYASLKPLDSDHLMEKVAEYQRGIDSHHAELDDLKEAVKDEKDAIKRFTDKIAMIGRAQDTGKPVYQLDGGELTDEEPDTESNVLPFHKGGEQAPEEPDEGEAEETETVLDLGGDEVAEGVEEPAVDL